MIQTTCFRPALGVLLLAAATAGAQPAMPAKPAVRQADYIVEDCASIEDRTIAGEINPAAARAVLASKQWRAAKLAPKKYGDKLQLGGADDLAPLQGGSVTVNNTIEIPPAEAYAKMLTKGA